MFITVEGSNGIGKSSIIKNIKEKLLMDGLKVFVTKEPTNSTLGDFIRTSESNYGGISYACLIASDRYFHIENEIIPQLADGNIVISDRYIESSLVLQCLDGVDIDFVWEINKKVLKPSLNIILTGDSSIVEERMRTRDVLSRFEKNYTRKQEIEQYNYVSNFLSRKGFNVLLVDNTSNAIETNIETIMFHIKNLLNTIN